MTPGHDKQPPDTPAALTPQAFAEAFNGVFRSLWLIAAGIIRDTTAAEDIVQDAAITAMDRLDQFKPGTNFKAWMAQFVRYTAMNHRRRAARRSAASLDAADAGNTPAPTTTEQPTGVVTTSGDLPDNQPWLDDQLMAELQLIDPVPRACLLLRTIEGLGYREIGELLEVPQGTAMSHVHRARLRLRKRLADIYTVDGPDK